jgi:integrase
MLKSTVGHIAMYAKLPADRIEIARLVDIKPELRAYLRTKGLRGKSIPSYTNYVRILLQKAVELGWLPCAPEVVDAWRDILAAVAKSQGCPGVVRYAIQKGKLPADFTDQDLDLWCETSIRNGRTYRWVVQVKGRFRKCLFEAGLSSQLPRLQPFVTDRIYGIPLSCFPDELRAEVDDLIRYKTDETSPGRPYKARHREVTAKNLKKLISRLFGFIVKEKGITVHSLQELFSQQFVSDFARWLVNLRKVSGRCVMIWLGTIRALRIYPSLKGHDFSWIPDLIQELPTDSEIRAQERKDRNWLSYDVLDKIPEQIVRNAGPTEESKALAFRDALLIMWLLVLAWRQRNIRECRVMPFAEGGNLFKEEIPSNSTMARPPWVDEALRTNPRERFWQFRFPPDQTKNGRTVRGILSQQLIEPLETYSTRYRPTLVDCEDDHRLFVNDHGRPLDPTRLDILVENLTFKYGGKRVNPHLFRDIVALEWLRHHPEDYLTVSKILWHRRIETTLGTYGRNFDESHGVRRMEEWLNERERRRKQGS